LELVRFLIPAFSAAAAVQTFLRIFREQVNASRLPWLRGHIIICGLSRKGFLLAGQFRKLGKQVVVIERDGENDWIESCREQGIFVLLGDAADPTLLNSAGVAQAEGLFAVCDHDGVNVEIALKAQQLAKNRKGNALICQLHVTDPQLCDLLRERELGFERAPFRLELFNVFERAARNMLQEYPAWKESNLIVGSPPRILLVGLGRMGENLLLHMARDWWNRQPHPSEKVHISIIDRDAVQKIESLNIRYPQINKVCEMVPLQIELHSPEFERAEFLFREQKQLDQHAIYVCLDDDALGLHVGLTLSRHIGDANIPIVVRMAAENGLARLLEFRRNHHGTYPYLFAFDYLGRTCTPDLLKSTPRDQLARFAHSEYIRKQIEVGAASPDDPSMRPWEQLDEVYCKANYQWVDHIPALLITIGYSSAPLSDWDAPVFQFTPDEIEILARMEHELWCTDKVADGWQYSSAPKDTDAKTHPDLVSWEHLSELEREKNRLLVANIPAFLGRAGYQVANQRISG
jgi:hypothetical protein